VEIGGQLFGNCACPRSWWYKKYGQRSPEVRAKRDGRAVVVFDRGRGRSGGRKRMGVEEDWYFCAVDFLRAAGRRSLMHDA
jgi:hypothetical protein